MYGSHGEASSSGHEEIRNKSVQSGPVTSKNLFPKRDLRWKSCRLACKSVCGYEPRRGAFDTYLQASMCAAQAIFPPASSFVPTDD